MLPARVRRQEDVGLREQVRERVDRQETIVEHDVCSEAEFEGATLEHQSVALAFTTLDVGVGTSRDRVHDVGMALDDPRQSVDHALDPLAGGDEAERGEPEVTRRPLRARPLGSLVEGRRRAVRNDPDIRLGTRA